MIQNEIAKEMSAIDKQIEDIKSKVAANKEQLRMSKTPQEIIDNYLRSSGNGSNDEGKEEKAKRA